jgi:hypothetical protein
MHGLQANTDTFRLNSLFADSDFLAFMRDRFRKDGFVYLGSLLSLKSYTQLLAEFENLAGDLRYRNFLMPPYNTPRHMEVLGGRKIADLSPFIDSLYRDPQILQLIRGITADEIHFCKHPEEFIVLNVLSRKGQTHGWHLDDPEYALVIALKSPSSGGLVEVLDENVSRQIAANGDYSVLDKHPPRRIRLLEGDAYLLRAGKCLHRVTSLENEGETRIVLNFAYENREVTDYGHTAYTLYS